MFENKRTFRHWADVVGRWSRVSLIRFVAALLLVSCAVPPAESADRAGKKPAEAGKVSAPAVPDEAPEGDVDEGDEGVTAGGEEVKKTQVSPEQRFQRFGDGTVLDRTTNLMWAEDANIPGNKMPWEEAEKFLGKMNRGEVPGYGYSDWRFPTVKEFETLADKAFTDPALPPEHPFTNVMNDYYWSGSTGHYIADYAWVMDMAYGFVHFDYRSYCNYLYLWPVRSATAAK